MRWFRYARAALMAALLGGGLAVPTVHASGADPVSADIDGLAAAFGTPVNADLLADTRGGFDVPGGLSLSLGIERVVSVNGEVMSRTSIAIPDLSAMTADQARLAHDALGSAKMIQIGNNNFVGSDVGLGNGALLLQNTLDGQKIQAFTTISSTVNSLSLLKDLNFQSTIRDAVVRSAGSL